MSNDSQRASSFLFAVSAPYVEELYETYLKDPELISSEWRSWFDSLQLDVRPNQDADVNHTVIVKGFSERMKRGSHQPDTSAQKSSGTRKQVSVQQLISAYRFLGVRWADLDPLRRRERPEIPELEPEFYGLTKADLASEFDSSGTFFGPQTMTLQDLLHLLKQTYCGTLGGEYMYISAPEQKRWWQEKLESIRSQPKLTSEQRTHILERLSAAEGLERFLHTRYVGQKRFSLEGGESFIVAMDALVTRAAQSGFEECVIGMAHRGRLNVLVNILGKTPSELFLEFEGKLNSTELPAGDVKYHNGYSSDVATPSEPIHLALEFNPSHLEIVDPVVAGSVRARQDRRSDDQALKVLGVMVHGDAAFAGQGVVMETLNLADTRGFGTGGTVHIVINNQIGFTTSDPRDKGSMTYCTDPAKLIEAPVLHVNGDDPETVTLAVDLALQYKTTFKHDVVVDIVCFRRLGHNEQDTPAVTQPLMYKKIKAHPGTRELYAKKLIQLGIVTDLVCMNMVESIKDRLRQGLSPKQMPLVKIHSRFAVDWTAFKKPYSEIDVPTGVPKAELMRLGRAITEIPPEFQLHPIVAKVLQDRRRMAIGEAMVDWGMAEHLAFASLVAAHYRVRISGEDSGRGTFSHRHAVLHDQSREHWDEGDYVPLQHVSSDQGSFTVIDSPLSEEAVLGFEYGYATSSPDALVIWEAQFGDFANGAQVVIDQFISSGEAKWGRLSGLTLMLPHGYEGQGPEHSSARIERYLQLSADDNMLIVQPSTAAQIFHVLRRQMVSFVRKPLILFTPKSLLRNRAANSTLEELANGRFQTVIGDASIPDVSAVRRIIICSGKVYYDLLRAREQQGKDAVVAIVRLEQIYPIDSIRLQAEISRYLHADEVVWCQDEPQNQGAWSFVSDCILSAMRPGQRLAYVGRAASSSPAVGYSLRHIEEQKKLLTEAFSQLRGLVRMR